jgi:uncharacterized protein YndB with AHSA1/START domain
MTEAKMAEQPKHVFEIYIKTTPEKLWQALTDGSVTPNYYYGSRVSSDWKPGSKYEYIGAAHKPGTEDTAMIAGEILEIDPPRRLVMSFQPVWGGEEVTSYPESRVTWEIAPAGEACKLTLVHDELTAGNPLTKEFFTGWSCILSGLKTFLETGEPLVITPAASE